MVAACGTVGDFTAQPFTERSVNYNQNRTQAAGLGNAEITGLFRGSPADCPEESLGRERQRGRSRTALSGIVYGKGPLARWWMLVSL